MKLKYVSYILFILLTLNSFGQEKIIRIGPGPLPNKPEPVVILDGIIVPSGSIEHVLVDNKDLIDSVSIQQDSIFDCTGKLVNLGIVRIYSQDSINSGAKMILKLTDNFIYQYPLTKLIINNIYVVWDESTFNKLTNLKTDDIIYAKVKESKRNKCDKTLKLKINE